LGLVSPVPRYLRRPPARRERCQRWFRQGSPPPGRGAITGAGTAVPGLDELGGIGVITHPVTHEPQPGQGSLHRLPRCRVLGPHDRFVCPVVIPRQGGIGEGARPDGVADHLEAARLVWRLLPGKPDGLRWIARREHRRRPRRLDPPPRPPRRPGHAGRRPGYAPLPDLADPRPPRQPRPAADP